MAQLATSWDEYASIYNQLDSAQQVGISELLIVIMLYLV
jgi:hypothetical protein